MILWDNAVGKFVHMPCYEGRIERKDVLIEINTKGLPEAGLCRNF